MRNLLKWRGRQLGIVPEISHVLGFSPQNEKNVRAFPRAQGNADRYSQGTRFKTSRSPADSIHYSLNGLV